VRAVYPNNIWQAAALGLSKTSPGGQQAGCLQCAEHPDVDCFVQNRTRVNFNIFTCVWRPQNSALLKSPEVGFLARSEKQKNVTSR
jgi:hypothetical protein